MLCVLGNCLTLQHCRRVWFMSVSSLKNALQLDVSVNQLSLFPFRALQDYYLYPVQTEQILRCIMCWNIKGTLFVRIGLICFIHDETWRKRSWLWRLVFLSSCVSKNTTTTQQSKLCTTVQPCVIPAPSVGCLMKMLGACGEMKDLIHRAPVPRSLLTTCAINSTNERCHVGSEQKTTKRFIMSPFA